MTVIPVRILGDPILRKKGSDIESVTPEILTLAQNMIETMFAYRGLGLAAQQVGYPLRMFVLNMEALEEGEKPRVFINGRIVLTEGENEDEEGCLSIPGLYVPLKRAYRVKLEALELIDRELIPVELDVTGLTARAVQHEVDHTEGILFIDHFPVEKRLILINQWKKNYEENLEKKNPEY